MRMVGFNGHGASESFTCRLRVLPAMENGYDRRMPHLLANTTSLLGRMPAVLDALLRDLPDTWTLRNEGDRTWSPFDIVGHLIHGERTDWMPRVRTVLQFGESRPFEAFDRLGHERDSAGKSLGELLDEFSRLRSESLSELRALNLRDKDLSDADDIQFFVPLPVPVAGDVGRS